MTQTIKTITLSLALAMLVALPALADTGADPANTQPQYVTFWDGAQHYRVDHNPELQLMDATPFIKEGRAYIPVRHLATALGIRDIAWRPSDITYVGDAGLTLGDPTMLLYVNIGAHDLGVAPTIIDGRMFLPATSIAKELGYGVTWDPTDRSILYQQQEVLPHTC